MIVIVIVGALMAIGAISYLISGESFWFWLAAFFAGLTLALSLLAVGAIAPYERHACKREMQGYGLKGYDWSFTNDCRLLLPNGHLVPDGSIRVTEDGKIFSDQ